MFEDVRLLVGSCRLEPILEPTLEFINNGERCSAAHPAEARDAAGPLAP